VSVQNLGRMSESQPATAYPTQVQYDRWADRAEEYGMSISEFIQAMVEAGIKKFDARVEPDESHRELREQRNNIKNELERARDRIDTLEDQLHGTERETIRTYVEKNPGATYEDVTQHIIDTAPDRINGHLDALQGESIEAVGDRYYPATMTPQEGVVDAA